MQTLEDAVEETAFEHEGKRKRYRPLQPKPPKERFEEVEILWRSTNLRVSLCRDRTNGKTLVIKRISFTPGQRTRHVAREVAILKALKHPRIIEVFNIVEADEFVDIHIPYATHGSLQTVLAREKHPLSEPRIALLADQVLDALQYLDIRQIVHRDIKPANVLVTSWIPQEVVLADFGLACSSSSVTIDNPTQVLSSYFLKVLD